MQVLIQKGFLQHTYFLVHGDVIEARYTYRMFLLKPRTNHPRTSGNICPVSINSHWQTQALGKQHCNLT